MLSCEPHTFCGRADHALARAAAMGALGMQAVCCAIVLLTLLPLLMSAILNLITSVSLVILTPPSSIGVLRNRVVLNLDLPPSERWTEIAKDYA